MFGINMGQAGRAVAVAGGCMFVGDLLLPSEDEKTEVLGSKKAKEAVMFGAAAAIILARDDPKALGYSIGAVVGILGADSVHHAIGGPKLIHYDEGHATERAVAPAAEPAAEVARVAAPAPAPAREPRPYLPPPSVPGPAAHPRPRPVTPVLPPPPVPVPAWGYDVPPDLAQLEP